MDLREHLREQTEHEAGEQLIAEERQRQANTERAIHGTILTAARLISRDWHVPAEGVDLDQLTEATDWLSEAAGAETSWEVQRIDTTDPTTMVERVILRLGDVVLAAAARPPHAADAWMTPSIALVIECGFCGALGRPRISYNISVPGSVHHALNGGTGDHVYPQQVAGPERMCNGRDVWIPEPPAPPERFRIITEPQGLPLARALNEAHAEGYRPAAVPIVVHEGLVVMTVERFREPDSTEEPF